MQSKTLWLAAALIVPIVPALAQGGDKFPQRPVRMILPYPAGGGVDANGRILAKALSDMWGKPVVVENMAGATTTLATKAVVQAKPDGYTIGLITSQLAINPALFKKMPYTSADFQPVTQILESPLYVIANPKTPASNFGDLLKYAKGHPNGITYASAGPGSITHLPVEVLQQATGVQMKQIPYIGAAAGMTATLSGEVNLTYTVYPVFKEMLKDGRVKVLAVASEKRTQVLPDVPSVKEFAPSYSGVAEWYGVIVPKGTPRPIVDKLYGDIKKALSTKELKDRFLADGNIVVGSTPEEFSSYLKEQTALWQQTISKIGLSLDIN